MDSDPGGADAATQRVGDLGVGQRVDEAELEDAAVGVTAGGADLSEALASAYEAVAAIQFDGMHYRRDIGQKGIRRQGRPAGATP